MVIIVCGCPCLYIFIYLYLHIQGRCCSLYRELGLQPHLYSNIQFAKIKHTYSLKYQLLKIVRITAHGAGISIKIISISLLSPTWLYSRSHKSLFMRTDCSLLSWYCGLQRLCLYLIHRAVYGILQQLHILASYWFYCQTMLGTT